MAVLRWVLVMYLAVLHYSLPNHVYEGMLGDPELPLHQVLLQSPNGAYLNSGLNPSGRTWSHPAVRRCRASNVVGTRGRGPGGCQWFFAYTPSAGRADSGASHG